jgi:hypothetical protein
MPQDTFGAGQGVSARNLRGCAHVCAIVHGSGEELEWLLPMLDEGTPEPVRTVRIVDGALAEHDAAREEAWRNDHAGVRWGDVSTTPWEDTYLVGGVFQQHAMLSRIDGIIGNGHRDGFPLVRIVADMAWAAGDVTGVHDLAEYESRLNGIIDPVGAEVVCVYDLEAFSRGVVVGLDRPGTSVRPGFLLDIIRAHPFVITDGAIRANRFYAPPETLLPELAARHAPRSAP